MSQVDAFPSHRFRIFASRAIAVNFQSIVRRRGAAFKKKKKKKEKKRRPVPRCRAPVPGAGSHDEKRLRVPWETPAAFSPVPSRSFVRYGGRNDRFRAAFLATRWRDTLFDNDRLYHLLPPLPRTPRQSPWYTTEWKRDGERNAKTHKCDFLFVLSFFLSVLLLEWPWLSGGTGGTRGGEGGEGVDSKSWRWRDVGLEKQATRNSKDIDAVRWRMWKKRKRERERETRRWSGEGFGGGTGVVAERAEVTFNVSRHAAQGSVSLASSSLLIWRQFPSNLPSKN